MEKRKLNIIFSKRGGNASVNSVGAKLSIPGNWLKLMNINPDDKEVLVTFDGEKIIIEKKV